MVSTPVHNKRVGNSGVIAGRLRKGFPTPSLSAFVALQMLDILTTVIGMRMGAQEASVFIGRLMNAGPMTGLLISKILAVALVATALKFKRARVVVFLNYWFAAVVSWNLLLIVAVELPLHL